MSVYGHSTRFGVVADRRMPIKSDSTVSYVQALGGRIFDLPPHYLDAGAEAIRWAHPRALFRRDLMYALVSDRFARSRHALLGGHMTPEKVRRFSRLWEMGLRRSVKTVVE